MKLILTTLTLLMIGCTNSGKKITEEDIFQKPTPGDSMSYYFPSVLNDSIKRIGFFFQDFKQKQYSNSLYSFKVPILYNKIDLQTTYRLLWLRSFNQPVCFSMKEYDGNYYLNAKTLDRHPESYSTIETHINESGKSISNTVLKFDQLAIIAFDTTIALKNTQWNEIGNYLSKLSFWKCPIKDTNEVKTTDGSDWIIEGLKNNKYHFIVRRNAQGTLLDFGKFLIKISGLKIEEEAIY